MLYITLECILDQLSVNCGSTAIFASKNYITARISLLCNLYGCFCVTGVELSSCDGDHMIHKAKYVCYLALYRESLLPSGFKHEK